MRVVSVTRLLDEADIIESFVRHTATFASPLIFIDNGSRDGTLEILEQLQAEGFKLLVYQNKAVWFNEAAFNTRMFQDAVRLFDADWVLCLDADEFIDDAHVDGGLFGALDRLRGVEPAISCLRVPLYEYRQTPHDDAEEINVPIRLRHHLAPFGIEKVILSGAIAGPDVTIGGGNHFAYRNGEAIDSREEPGLRLAHFSERSPHRLAAKWIKGWARVIAGGPETVASGAAGHYRGMFETLRDDPAALLRSDDFLNLRDSRPMSDDPMAYRGGPLVFTSRINDQMRAVRMIVGYLEELACRHGYLLENSPEAKAITEAWDDDLKIVMGQDLMPAAIPAEPASAPPATAKRHSSAGLMRSWLDRVFNL